MLEDAKGVNCQASNFSRTFSATPQADALGLIDVGEKSTAPYGSLIQNFNRWLLSTFSAESIVDGQTFPVIPLPSGSCIDQVFGIDVRTTNICSACDYESVRLSTLHVIDLAYPKKAAETPSFAELLCSCIIRTTSTRASCVDCKQFVPLESKRSLAPGSDLPAVMSINAMVSSEDVFEPWKGKGFLPPRIGFALGRDGDMTVSEVGVQYEVKVGGVAAELMVVYGGPDSRRPRSACSFGVVCKEYVDRRLS